ncbi:MAG: hypothetical protein SFW07_07245 [Gammaproteobacteria bacterium]|nr:hypothetical protein [Gammaproteobacteria bacterium]
MEDNFSRHLAEVGITAQGFSAFVDADQARLRFILSHLLDRRFLAQLIKAPSFSLPLFLRQSDELQATMIFRANNMVLLMNHVIPFDKLLEMEEPLRSEFIEWGREVKKLVHDYRIPLADLLKLNPEQRSELIVNANYFTEILRAPENQRTVDQLLNIGALELTEAQALQRVNAAVQQLQGNAQVVLRELSGRLPAEMIVRIFQGARDPLFVGPDQARRIIEDVPLEDAPQPPVSQRPGNK